MPVGLQVWDPLGNLIVDITTRLTKLSGTAWVSGPGNVSISVPAGNLVFATFIRGGGDGFQLNPPFITISANSISWGYAANRDRIFGTILYGTY